MRETISKIMILIAQRKSVEQLVLKDSVRKKIIVSFNIYDNIYNKELDAM
jgi:hypothetical protein